MSGVEAPTKPLCGSKRPEKFTVALSGAVKIGAKLFRAEDLAK
jgi:hypothetical protein